MTAHETESAETPENAENVVSLNTDGGANATIAALQAEVNALKDQALRAMAETENTRKRAAKERDDAMKYGTTALAKELLGVADNLRRALDHTATLEGEAAKNFVAGVEATERQLLQAFERAGIKKVEPLGEMFDPNFHRVMMEMDGTGKAAGTVVQVLQPGYVIHDRLLREALVGVAKGDSAQQKSVNTTA
jgi:molecular chaperone GrpE